MIEARDLSWSYGRAQVLQAVSLAAPHGRVLGLIGPNGSGKTTLLRLLYGALSSPTGEVALDGDPLAAADHAVRIGLVTQEELRAEALAVPPRAGGRQGAQAVAALADPLAESTGESLSRFGFWQLGFPRPRLQVEFHDAAGFIGRTDAFWEAARLIGEFDGRVKYRVPPNATPDQASKVLWDEKRREDRLRRVVAGVARWTWREALHRERLRAVLIGHGLRPSDQPWFDPVTLELL